MPRYVYHCDLCDSHFQVRHGMKEHQTLCTLCNQESNLTRVPQMPSIKTDTEQDKSTGTLTKDYIEKNRKLLHDMKSEARSQEYDG